MYIIKTVDKIKAMRRKMNTLYKLRKHLKKNCNIEIDFKTERFAPNNYGLKHVIEYDKLERIVTEVLRYCGFDDNQANVKTVINMLESTSLKVWMHNVVWYSKSFLIEKGRW